MKFGTAAAVVSLFLSALPLLAQRPTAGERRPDRGRAPREGAPPAADTAAAPAEAAPAAAAETTNGTASALEQYSS
ncbi:MAG: hypothetical protein GX548_13340, partial [Lentisphaerae bacterium]|nr:hypothetical protein [Lentisphaerota bacterium]